MFVWVCVCDLWILWESQDGMCEKKIKRQGQIQAQQEGKGRSLAPLKKGEPVLVQDVQARKTQWMRGHYLEQLTDRSGIEEVDGRLLHRNRQLPKPTPNAPQVPWRKFVRHLLLSCCRPGNLGPCHPKQRH